MIKNVKALLLGKEWLKAEELLTLSSRQLFRMLTREEKVAYLFAWFVLVVTAAFILIPTGFIGFRSIELLAAPHESDSLLEFGRQLLFLTIYNGILLVLSARTCIPIENRLKQKYMSQYLASR